MPLAAAAVPAVPQILRQASYGQFPDQRVPSFVPPLLPPTTPCTETRSSYAALPGASKSLPGSSSVPVPPLPLAMPRVEGGSCTPQPAPPRAHLVGRAAAHPAWRGEAGSRTPTPGLPQSRSRLAGDASLVSLETGSYAPSPGPPAARNAGSGSILRLDSGSYAPPVVPPTPGLKGSTALLGHAVGSSAIATPGPLPSTPMPPPPPRMASSASSVLTVPEPGSGVEVRVQGPPSAYGVVRMPSTHALPGSSSSGSSSLHTSTSHAPPPLHPPPALATALTSASRAASVAVMPPSTPSTPLGGPRASHRCASPVAPARRVGWTASRYMSPVPLAASAGNLGLHSADMAVSATPLPQNAETQQGRSGAASVQCPAPPLPLGPHSMLAGSAAVPPASRMPAAATTATVEVSPTAEGTFTAARHRWGGQAGGVGGSSGSGSISGLGSNHAATSLASHLSQHWHPERHLCEAIPPPPSSASLQSVSVDMFPALQPSILQPSSLGYASLAPSATNAGSALTVGSAIAGSTARSGCVGSAALRFPEYVPGMGLPPCPGAGAAGGHVQPPQILQGPLNQPPLAAF